MIQLTARQVELMVLIESSPGIMQPEIAERLGVSSHSCPDRIRALMNKGPVRREGTATKYKHYGTGEPYELISKGGVERLNDSSIDPLLKEAALFRLSEEQLQVFKANKGMPRTELARKLGVSKLELNFAMISLTKN